MSQYHVIGKLGLKTLPFFQQGGGESFQIWKKWVEGLKRRPWAFSLLLLLPKEATDPQDLIKRGSDFSFLLNTPIDSPNLLKLNCKRPLPTKQTFKNMGVTNDPCQKEDTEILYLSKNKKQKATPQEDIASAISTEVGIAMNFSHEKSLRHSTSPHGKARHTNSIGRRLRNAPETKKS